MLTSNARRTSPTPEMRLTALFGCLAAVLLVAACGRGSVDQAQKYLVYDQSSGPEEGEYVLSEEKIGTLDNLPAVEGEVARLRAGGNIETPVDDPTTREEFKNSMQISGDRTPNADYEIRSNGLLVPWDFDSTMMFTLYHHLEEARGFFVEHGVSEQTLGTIPVYYNTSVQALLPIDQLQNNAAYVFTLDAFLVPPSVLEGKVPLAANRGVIVHEYSHLIFNRLVHRNKRVPDYLLEAAWADAPQRMMDTLNEGVADTFAGLQTGESNFIGVSISDDDLGMSRDLANPDFPAYTQQLKQCIENASGPCVSSKQFNPYLVGSTIASIVWSMKVETGLTKSDLTRAVVGALRKLGTVAETGPNDFDIATYFNALHADLPAEHQDEACTIMQARLPAIRNELTACSL